MKRPEEDPTSIGNVLVDLGFITVQDLERAVREFKELKEEFLGEFLIRKTQLTEDQLHLALLKQSELRGKPPTHSAVVKAFGASLKSNDRLLSTTEEITRLTTLIANKA